MPLPLSSHGVDSWIAFYVHDHCYGHIYGLCRPVLDLLFVFRLVQLINPLYFAKQGLGRTRSCGSCRSLFPSLYNALKETRDSASVAETATVITVEANERTPLLDHTNGQLRESSAIAFHRHGKDDKWNATSSIDTDNSSSSFYYYGNTKTQYCDCRLMAIVFILVTGVTIATYLLLTESRGPSLRFSLDLVNHDIWSRMTLPLGGVLNHTHVQNILMMHTGGVHCTTTDNCTNLLTDMQMQANASYRSEVAQNFLIGGDGLTYEVRGWDHANGIDAVPLLETSLVIGLIGNYTCTSPSDAQLQSALALIRESIRRKKLQRKYHVYGLRNRTASAVDGQQLHVHVASWPGFERVLPIIAVQ